MSNNYFGQEFNLAPLRFLRDVVKIANNGLMRNKIYGNSRDIVLNWPIENGG
jgi:hypothetical protein